MSNSPSNIPYLSFTVWSTVIAADVDAVNESHTDDYFIRRRLFHQLHHKGFYLILPPDPVHLSIKVKVFDWTVCDILHLYEERDEKLDVGCSS